MTLDSKIIVILGPTATGKSALAVTFAKKVKAKEIFGSHLLLGEKTVRPAEGGTPNSFGKMGGNQWDALRASHHLALKKPLSSVLVPEERLELSWVSPHDFESCAYTNSATPALLSYQSNKIMHKNQFLRCAVYVIILIILFEMSLGRCRSDFDDLINKTSIKTMIRV